ncbi:MAG: hypothetical protein Q8N09_02375 [Thermodesulfovibrionia bacterium]|nr:hypothetical protein [Thermodesulfovibrionia bacterium]
MRRTILSVSLCALLTLALFLSYPYTATTGHEETTKAAPKEEVPYDRPVEEIKKYLAPMNKFRIFQVQEVSSCLECHDKDWEANPQRRELGEPHDETPGKFINHDSENRWCLDCHSAKNRDKLRLINGKLVDFKEYYRLCEQCHKKIYREWKMGVHGKTTGYWNGVKEYMHCAQCHDSHDPPFKSVKPEPPPIKPVDLRKILTEMQSNSAAEK